jgi:hypothetical protein
MSAALTALASSLKALPPWLSPYALVAQQVLNAASSESVAAALNAARGKQLDTLRFVDQSALPSGESYESFIARTNCIPTRDDTHDLFNGLMWLSYPKTKQRLNALHARAIEQQGGTGSRGPLRDALTVFDENAALLQAPAELIEALRLRDWKALFLTRRALWQSARLLVFGHALMQKLMSPRKAITAHVWLVQELEDVAIAATLSPERLTTKTYLPLPVLGVPGWWAANEEPSFYEDAGVFRPTRR